MFNENERPSFIRRFLFLAVTEFIYMTRLKNKFSAVKSHPMIWGIRNIVVYGDNISLGERVLLVAAPGFRTTLTTLAYAGKSGEISIGNDVMIMNGVRISSASRIIIGDECMLANFSYIMDADWHDLHDRNRVPGKTLPVVLERNVWVGDSAIICKGVTIGENSIIGAGSVVTKNIPPNVIAAGNPARVVKKLDPSKIVPRKPGIQA